MKSIIRRTLVIVLLLGLGWSTTGCTVTAQQVSAIMQVAGALMQQVGQSGVVNQGANGSTSQTSAGQTGSLVSTAGQGFGLPVANDPQSQTIDPATSSTTQDQLASSTPASTPQVDAGTSADTFEPVAGD